jgi:hypothetical protein
MQRFPKGRLFNLGLWLIASKLSGLSTELVISGNRGYHFYEQEIANLWIISCRRSSDIVLPAMRETKNQHIS